MNADTVQRERIRILSFSTVFPTRVDPTAGVFIKTRLEHLAALTHLHVLLPSAVFNYAQRKLRFRQQRPAAEVVHTTNAPWIYPPAGGALNAFFLSIQMIAPISRIRREFDFDLIDAHFAHPEGVAAAFLASYFRRPFTITMRGNEQMHSQHWLRRRMMSHALRKAGRVIAVAEKLRGLAAELGVDPSKVVTIPNGIDADVFYPRDRARSRSKLGIPDDSLLIVTAGHLIELKGHHHVIASVRTLLQKGMNVQLIIAGGRGRSTDYEPTLRRQITNLGLSDRVRLIGHQDRNVVAELFCAADVFCLASSREGWPNVLHEALACGTPVVASNVGGVPEMIPSQEYGIIVPPNDQISLEQGLADALTRSWDRTQIAAWGQTRSWSQVAQEVLNVMQTVVSEFRSAI